MPIYIVCMLIYAICILGVMAMATHCLLKLCSLNLQVRPPGPGPRGAPALSASGARQAGGHAGAGGQGGGVLQPGPAVGPRCGDLGASGPHHIPPGER